MDVKSPETAPPAPSSDLVLRPLRSGNVFEETMERLMQAIKLGAIPFGERLPSERDLAAKLEVSRSTLREVIRALQELGFAEVRRGRGGGTFAAYKADAAPEVEARQVALAMGDDFLDALDFRSVIEPAAAERAARRASSADVEHLRALLPSAEDELVDYRSGDSRLHLAIADLSGSRLLSGAVADLHLRLTDLVIALPRWDEALQHSDEQHEQLLGAIERGDADRARTVMFEHVTATATLLRELCSEPDGAGPADQQAEEAQLPAGDDGKEIP